MADAPVSAKFSYRFLPLESPLPSPDLFFISHCPEGKKGGHTRSGKLGSRPHTKRALLPRDPLEQSLQLVPHWEEDRQDRPASMSTHSLASLLTYQTTDNRSMSNNQHILLYSLKLENDRLQPHWSSATLPIPEGGLTTEIVVRFRTWCSMGIRVRQESFPFIWISLHRLLRREPVPYTSALSARILFLGLSRTYGLISAMMGF